MAYELNVSCTSHNRARGAALAAQAMAWAIFWVQGEWIALAKVNLHHTYHILRMHSLLLTDMASP